MSKKPEEVEDYFKRRQSYLDEILKSKNPKKIIVSGPGTGKTYTFSKIFESKGDGNFLALTFIRNLADSLAEELPSNIEARTFHSFCKRILHEQKGMVSIFPGLSKIIEGDARFINPVLSGFIEKFQALDETSQEIPFFIGRGDYYNWLSFEDAVYRLYKILQENKDIFPDYDQIVIDEFQDFNPLEVAFINELENKGPILIVGDDDQALYFSLKNASPDFIREKHKSGEYEQFELPFCSRCPQVIVNCTNSFIEKILKGGRLGDRIKKEFWPFLPGMEEINGKYNKIKYVELSMISSIVKYITCAIGNITDEEIKESYDKGFPTVLILGSPHYLEQIYKNLFKKFTNVELRISKPFKGLPIVDAYEMLAKDIHSNLGWRILAENFLDASDLELAVKESVGGNNFDTILNSDLLDKHKTCLKLIQVALKEERTLKEEEVEVITRILGIHSDPIIEYFFTNTEDEPEVIDISQPKILLTSFVGCKGLSGGHVFITGFWNGELPKTRVVEGKAYVDDVEISKFIVALTRTRKECHLIYNKWMIQPKSKDGEWIPANTRSRFRRLLNDDYIEDLGLLNSAGIDEYFKG